MLEVNFKLPEKGQDLENSLRQAIKVAEALQSYITCQHKYGSIQVYPKSDVFDLLRIIALNQKMAEMKDPDLLDKYKTAKKQLTAAQKQVKSLKESLLKCVENQNLFKNNNNILSTEIDNVRRLNEGLSEQLRIARKDRDLIEIQLENLKQVQGEEARKLLQSDNEKLSLENLKLSTELRKAKQNIKNLETEVANLQKDHPAFNAKAS